MQLREHAAVVTKRDYFLVDPRKIVVDPTYNVRHLDTPEAQEKLSELSRDIAANGVKVPLEIRLGDNNQVILVAGHRRLRATLAAIKDGADIVSVPAIAEAKTTNEAERVLALHTSNTGEPLAPLERAEIVRRLLAYNWTRENIAKRMGYATV